MDATNPLLREFLLRKNLSHGPSARSAPEHLLTAIHEAGHWFAYADAGVPVVTAFIDMRPGRVYGCITPTDPCGFVEQDSESAVEFVAALAGPAAMYALFPYVSRKHVADSATSDIEQMRAILDRIGGHGSDARLAFRNEWTAHTEKLVRESWPSIEALAFELMRNRRMHLHETERVQARYGIGFRERGYDISKASRHRLAEFNSSPVALTKWLHTHVKQEQQKRKASYSIGARRTAKSSSSFLRLPLSEM